MISRDDVGAILLQHISVSGVHCTIYSEQHKMSNAVKDEAKRQNNILYQFFLTVTF